MSQFKFHFGFWFALITACLFFLASCGTAADPQKASEPYVLTGAAAPTIAYGTKLAFADAADADARVTRAVVDKNGQALTAEYDVETDGAGTFVHAPFGGIFEAPASDGTVRIRYSRTAGTDVSETVTVCSAFPDFENSDLSQILTAALADGSAVQSLHAVSGDTDGDGKAETIALCLTADGIPFLTADGDIALCLRACDPAHYDGADMLAIDLGGGQDATVLIWENLWNLNLQCAVEDTDGWRELALPNPEVAAMLSAPYRIDFTMPDGHAISLDAREYAALADCFDKDGKPYRQSGSVTFRIDSPHETVDLDGHAALCFTGYPILCACGADGEGEFDFAALPMTLYIKDGALTFAYGALVAE